MSSHATSAGRLLAISDVHVGNPENREVVGGVRAESDDDWLIVAGDVAERPGHAAGSGPLRAPGEPLPRAGRDHT